VCIARQGPARLAGGMAGLRRLIGGGPRGEAGDAHAAAAAAAARAEATAETGVALGLAAFAVSAFVKSVLCPALSAYTPRVSTSRWRATPSHHITVCEDVFAFRWCQCQAPLPFHGEPGVIFQSNGVKPRVL